MTRQPGPHKSSRAYKALVKLQAMGGRATLAQWMSLIAWDGSISGFKTAVIFSLVHADLVELVNDTYSMTDECQQFLGIPVDAPPVAPPVIVGPRYQVGIRDLSVKNMGSMRVTREGALDYRDIPSRMGDRLVPHGSKA